MFSFSHKSNYAFRGFRYATCKVQFHDKSKADICINSDNSMNIINQKFLQRLSFEIKMIKMTSPLPIQRIGDKIVKMSEIVLIQFNLLGQIIKKKFKISRTEITTSFNAEFHIVDSFSTNVTLKNDVLISQEIFINLSIQNFRIEACKDI